LEVGWSEKDSLRSAENFRLSCAQTKENGRGRRLPSFLPSRRKGWKSGWLLLLWLRSVFPFQSVGRHARCTAGLQDCRMVGLCSLRKAQAALAAHFSSTQSTRHTTQHASRQHIQHSTVQHNAQCSTMHSAQHTARKQHTHCALCSPRISLTAHSTCCLHLSACSMTSLAPMFVRACEELNVPLALPTAYQGAF